MLYVSQQSWQLFLDKVELQENGCWLWQGATVRGYGKLKRNGKYYRAHRWAWEAKYGPMSLNAVAMHKCDTPLCVNPDCIKPGTQQQNINDMLSKRRHARHSIDRCTKCGGEFTQYKDRRRCNNCRRQQYKERLAKYE